MAETVSAQVSAAVQVALAPAARYAALVTQANPLGPASQLLARPDIEATLIAALEQARLAEVYAVKLVHVGLYQLPESEDGRPAGALVFGTVDAAREPRDRVDFAGALLRRVLRFGAIASPCAFQTASAASSP